MGVDSTAVPRWNRNYIFPIISIQQKFLINKYPFQIGTGSNCEELLFCSVFSFIIMSEIVPDGK